MEKQPGFIKEFTKKASKEERDLLAKEIRAKRGEHFAKKRSLSEEKGSIDASLRETGEDVELQLQELDVAKKRIVELSESGLQRLWNYFKIKKLEAEVQSGTSTYEELQRQHDASVDTMQALESEIAQKEQKVPDEFVEAKTMLQNFYKEQKRKWEKSSYTRKDIEENFTEEHLASLSLEDYELLMRRFPNEMVLHVTRQGIRDHGSLIFHTGGMDAYADGFMKMSEDGRLRSPLGVYLVEDEKEKTIEQFLHLDTYATKEEALSNLERLKARGGQGSYADRMAVHFAAEEVADDFYGSEKGNEIFMAYPSAFIASQYYFKGDLHKAEGGYWNDKWVWANEEKGMDLNAGVVFLPKETMVDAETGSRYELDEKKQPIENTEYIDLLQRFFASEEFLRFAEEGKEITTKIRGDWNDTDFSANNYELLKRLEPFLDMMKEQFGITDPRLHQGICQYKTFDHLGASYIRNDSFRLQLEIKELLKDAGVFFVESKNTMQAQDFWERYFVEHPKARPNKIVYYRGDDPTTVFRSWRDRAGMKKKSQAGDLGFSERHVSADSDIANKGHERFIPLAEEVIKKYFANK
ncbi:MAG: hypothetical protein V1848_01370 [Candidatus Magasanikbacteria bacterium]